MAHKAARSSFAHVAPLALLLVVGCGRLSASAGPGARDTALRGDASELRLERTVERPDPALARALAVADSIIDSAIGTTIPGAVLAVSRDSRLVHERAFGYAQLEDMEGRRLPAPRTMQATTMFDLASVTKVMATTFALMLLVDRGLLDVEAPAWTYLSEFRGPHLDSVTVRHLLEHSAGLAQWQPMYYQAATAEETFAAIRRMPLSWGVGAERRYSDLGFMVLGYLVERVSGRRLDVYLREELYAPLGLHTIVFNPRRHGFTDFAVTEPGNVYERRMVYDRDFGYLYEGDPAAWSAWRDYVLDGEVDDGNAWYAHGGVAGHAGLFGTARELTVLLDLLIARGTFASRRVLRPETIEQFLTPARFGHYLGWQIPRGMPVGSFAHNGFTGTYVLGVPAHGLSIVLLTNRQNLGVNERGYFPDVGPLQQAVARAIVEGAAGAHLPPSDAGNGEFPPGDRQGRAAVLELQRRNALTREAR